MLKKSVVLLAISISFCAALVCQADNLNQKEIKFQGNDYVNITPIALINDGRANPIVLAIAERKDGSYSLIRFKLNVNAKAKNRTVLFESENPILSVSVVKNGSNSAVAVTIYNDQTIDTYMIRKVTKSFTDPVMTCSVDVQSKQLFSVSKIAPWGNGFLQVTYSPTTVGNKRRVEFLVKRFKSNGNQEGATQTFRGPKYDMNTSFNFVQPVCIGDKNVLAGYTTFNGNTKSMMRTVKFSAQENGRVKKSGFKSQGSLSSNVNTYLYADFLPFKDLGNNNSNAVISYWEDTFSHMGDSNLPPFFTTTSNQNNIDLIELDPMNNIPIFSDGFESGNTSVWTNNSPNVLSDPVNAPSFTFLMSRFLSGGAQKNMQIYTIIRIDVRNAEAKRLFDNVKRTDLVFPAQPVSTIMKNNELWVVWGGYDFDGNFAFYLSRTQ